MLLKLTTKYDIGAVVYLKAAPEMAGVVCGYVIHPGNHYQTIVCWADHEEAIHYDIELTDEKPL